MVIYVILGSLYTRGISVVISKFVIDKIFLVWIVAVLNEWNNLII